MVKKTKIKHHVRAERIVPVAAISSKGRVPRHSATPNLDAPIAWNFKRMDSGGKFKCTLKMLHDYARELVKLEEKTVSQLMEQAHNHPMATSKLSDIARARITALSLDIETIHQLDLKTPARLWGVLEHNIFHIIWLDPDHGVYKCR